MFDIVQYLLVLSRETDGNGVVLGLSLMVFMDHSLIPDLKNQ